MEPAAHKIKDLAYRGPFGRSKLFEEIKAGRLPARKSGRDTIILDSDWRAYLASPPKRKVAA